MFEVKPHKIIIKGLHEIVDNFYSLINDGDNDILYTGTNKFGNRILGSIVFEDDEKEYLRYFHIIITDKQYSSFINRKISLRNILDESEIIFIIDKGYNKKIIDYNISLVSDIPKDFLPLENSLFPSFIKDSSLDYSFSLKGGLSDLHKADPEVMSSVNNKFSSFLKNSLEFVKVFNITPVVYSETAMAGSFELNFKIEFTETQTLFSKPNNDIVKFIRGLYGYIFGVLPTEEPGVLKESVIVSEDFIKIEKEFEDIFIGRSNTVSDKEHELINIITYSVNNLKDIEYKGFDRVELINKTDQGLKLPVATIESNFYQSIEDKIYQPESITRIPLVELDPIPVEYSIEVYALNSKTGVGKIYLDINEDTRVNASLYLSGKENYTNTVFTKSMDEKIVIKVNAIAKKIDGVYKILFYNYS